MTVQHYAIIPGQLFAGEYPGHFDPEEAVSRLSALADEGVKTFIDLTPTDDPLEPYEDLLPSAGTGLRYFRHPIRDMDVPKSAEVMHGILNRIREELAAGNPCYFHCWGGIGRTGTVAGCWFREQGLGPEEALEAVQALYATMPKSKGRSHPYSPQTGVQYDYVRNWPQTNA